MCVNGLGDASSHPSQRVLRENTLYRRHVVHVVTVIVKDRRKCYIVKSSTRIIIPGENRHDAFECVVMIGGAGRVARVYACSDTFDVDDRR